MPEEQHIAVSMLQNLGETAFLKCMQVAAQAERQNALGKLAELEGILQQALDQRTQASEEAHRSQSQLAAQSGELSASQQQLQRQQQQLAILQVSSALAPLLWFFSSLSCSRHSS